ncbi:MAG: hypothetical protein K2Y33_04685 [Mycolicibacterium frederiksbergense]|nr:hypothetical protein [Mycolicibacterium frederiksbergense]
MRNAITLICAAAIAASVLGSAPADAEPTEPSDPFASVERWNPGLIFEPRSGAKDNDMGPRKKVQLGVHTVRQVGDPGFGPKPMSPRP